MISPSVKVLNSFQRAGWQPSRSVPVPAHVPRSHPAWQVLAQFGGLSVGSCGTGIECAASDLGFRPSPPDDNDEEIIGWQQRLGSTLVSVADVHQGHGELFVDAAARCFCRSYVHDAFTFEGDTVEQAIENILLGIRARPMLRPDQTSINLYGINFAADDPSVYRYG